MNGGNRNDVSSVFLIEIFEIRGVLEIVSVDLSAFNDIVGLNIVGKFLNFKGNIFFCKNILSNCQDLCVGSGRRRNGNGLSRKSGIINGRIVSVGQIVNDRNNGAVIF